MAALWEWKRTGKAAQSCQRRVSATCGVCSGVGTLLDKSCRIYLKEMYLFGKHGHVLWTIKVVLIWTLGPNSKNSTPRHLLTIGADIEPAKSGDRRNLFLTRTIPLITDWNWILSFFVLDALFDLPCFYCFQKSHMLYSPSTFLGRQDVCMLSSSEWVLKHIEMFLFEKKKKKNLQDLILKHSRHFEPLWEACTMALTCSNSK